MEISVWSRLSALVATFVLCLSSSLPAAPNPRNRTLSYDVHANAVALTSTSKKILGNEKNILRIKREKNVSGKTGESRFGSMAYEGRFICLTLEHESVKIPAGVYKGELRWSERFQEYVPYIRVPNRSGIEVHRGNCFQESGGCVLVGTARDGACLRNSKLAFDNIVKVLPSSFTVVVENSN